MVVWVVVGLGCSLGGVFVRLGCSLVWVSGSCVCANLVPSYQIGIFVLFFSRYSVVFYYMVTYFGIVF